MAPCLLRPCPYPSAVLVLEAGRELVVEDQKTMRIELALPKVPSTKLSLDPVADSKALLPKEIAHQASHARAH